MGIRAIKGEGGMAMVQQPDTAKYDGMPRSAVETGLLDFIIPVEKMPETLIRYAQHPFLALQGKIERPDTPIKSQIQKVFALIRGATGHDFWRWTPKAGQPFTRFVLRDDQDTFYENRQRLFQ